jgi:hypothetical protein
MILCRFSGSVKALHSTEEKYPEQTKAFREMIEKMYQVHLDKNLDYSPSNINGVGMIGLASRTWDKVIRFLNLVGFNIDAKLISFNGSKVPKK